MPDALINMNPEDPAQPTTPTPQPVQPPVPEILPTAAATEQPLTASPTPPIMHEIPKPKNKFVIFLVALLILVGLVSLGYWAYQNYFAVKPVPVASPSPTPEATADPTANWKTYIVNGLGIEFKLPEYFSPLDYPNGNETKGEKGKQFCIEYTKIDIVSFLIKNVIAGGGACLPQYFGLGTTSIDYEAGRMGGFGDLQGYTYENGKYYAKMNLGKKFEMPTELTKEVTNPNGVKILIVIGKNNLLEQEGNNFPITGTPGDGRIGALVNLNNAIYPGVTVEMKLEGGLNTQLFDQILSTFKFLDEKSSVYPNYNHYVNSETNFSIEYPSFLSHEEYKFSDSNAGKMTLFCETPVDINKIDLSQGTPHCQGGGLTIWFTGGNPGWGGGCNPESHKTIAISGQNLSYCNYPTSFGQLGLDTNKYKFLFSGTYSNKFTEQEAIKTLTSFKSAN